MLFPFIRLNWRELDVIPNYLRKTGFDRMRFSLYPRLEEV